MVVSSLRGWGLCRSNGQVVGETGCSASATRRPLFAQLDDPRRSCCHWESRGQAGSAKPLACEWSAASASDRRVRSARQQECSCRLGDARRKCLLRTRAIRSGGLIRVNDGCEEVLPGDCNEWQEMVKRSHCRFPNLMCGPAWQRPMSGGRGGGSARKFRGLAAANSHAASRRRIYVTGSSWPVAIGPGPYTPTHESRLL
jgi:hypothetical protein